MDEGVLVNFIIAGVQKGGTTALFDYLADEPGVALSQVKEVHFFDDENQDWSRPDYAAYHAHFSAADGRPCGEATPIYIYWPNSLERIRDYSRAMKLIVLLRDPVHRAWSHWRMEFARGAETEPFAWCIREGRRRLFDAAPWGHHREFSYVERGFYGEQMERLFGLFPREQVLVLKAEDLRADPAATLAQVRAFVGAPEGPPPRPRDVHVGRQMDYPSTLTAEDIGFLRRLYARDMARLRELTGVNYA
ncbi:sulfotransferase domain-containing protein [Phenylobacterium sp.]|uniref:sulfotransferase domain-containing protein n=1 Tax=Phenylobacterium sp. TaxID=1871053 RepID=UPI002FE1068D